MFKQVSNNPAALDPTSQPNASENLKAAAAEETSTSHKIKLVAGGILGALALTGGLYMASPHVLSYVSNFGAFSHNNSTNIVALTKAQTSLNDHDWLQAGEHCMHAHNYTGAFDWFTKCVNHGGNNAKLCQLSLQSLSNNIYTTALTAEYERKFDQAEELYKLCAEQGGPSSEKCKSSSNSLKREQELDAAAAQKTYVMQTLHNLMMRQLESGNQEEFANTQKTHNFCRSQNATFTCYDALIELFKNDPDKQAEIKKDFKKAFPNVSV